VASENSGATPERRKSAWRRWPKWILLFLISLWVVDFGISLLLQHTRLHRKITARLESAFGRPVEVGGYNFSLWGGPTIEAQSVLVAEDPRFGQEYFLRAESLTVRFRWRGLLRGHFELGTLSLTRPSLNLVRNANGDWNLNEWLPRPAGAPVQNIPMGPVRRQAASVLRFGRIEVDGGRINFKNGDEKIPFALVNVNGALETESPGSWRIDLDATPTRAAVVLQQVGVLHLAGHLGGTSSRLRPALLELSWQDASITDLLRLARTYDYGIHGTMAVSISARTEGDAWLLDGRAELRHVHRYDLPLRGDNPSLNFIAQGKLDLPGARLELTQATLEGPHSNAHAAGVLDWNHPGKMPKEGEPGTLVNVTAPAIGLEDVLAWMRAFHSNVAEDISLRGSAGLNMTLRDWPPRVDRGSLVINGAELNGKELRVPVLLGSASVRYEHEILSGGPVAVSFGDSRSALSFLASWKLSPIQTTNLRVAGNLAEARDILSTTKALGWDLARGWDFGGPARCNLVWADAEYPWQARPAGTVDWGGESGGGSLRAPFLNQPVERIKAHADIKSGERRITISSAQAFGARWTGNLERRNPDADWEFALAADKLSSADLDLWLNPRWRQSFLDRMLPFLNPRGPSGGAVAEGKRASGSLSIGELSLAPFHASHLTGNLAIDGRRVEFENVHGEFYGGKISGSLDAGLVVPPAYHVGLQFTSVDLNAATAATPNLAGLFAGSASGQISFHARGASRADLMASLECEGSARVAGAELRAMNLAESLSSGIIAPGTSSFRDASGTFSCAGRKIEFRETRLSGAASEIAVAGSVDFTRNLDLQLQVLPAAEGAPRVTKASATPASGAQLFRLSGSLAAPQIERIAVKASAPPPPPH